MSTTDPVVKMEVVTDPVELAKAREQDERFEKNWTWFTEHAEEIYRTQRGKCLCIAGQQLFVGDTATEALEQAISAHPEDNGRLVHTYYSEGEDGANLRRYNERVRR